MSCSSKKTLRLTLLSLIIFLFFSCSKEEILIKNTSNTETIKEETIVEVTPTDSLNDQVLSHTLVVLESEKILRNLIVQSIYQLYFYPQLADLQSNQATTRGCPMSSINLSETQVTLTYDGCNTSSSVNYDGEIVLTIDGTIGMTGTTVDMVLSEDFTINGDQEISGFVKLKYDGIANQKYDITELEIDNNSTFPPTEVRLSSSGQVAHFELFDVNGDDNNSNPLSFLDNEIWFDPYLTVHCPNPDGSTQTILEVEPVASVVKYTIDCGTPYDGEIHLTNSATGEQHSSIDFAYPNTQSNAVCDDLINVCKLNESGGIECEEKTF